MAALALPESPPGLGSIGCGMDPSRPALSFANDEDLVTRTSSPTGLTASSTTPPLIPRRKSAFRASRIESQHVAEQHTANIRKTVHFDDSFKKTRLFLPADAPLALAASKPSLTAWEADSTGRTCDFLSSLAARRDFA
ncbi:hypothetical protein PITC_022780 [Penicillium italicum]|uniref:Uncharacterized protein n=1 Tax=Penicillium italicum TaxID=40296 RepID=A0A0A2K995_PENIT|nr:hypothetical protein PITC_022780 [Penicillium italicum]